MYCLQDTENRKEYKTGVYRSSADRRSGSGARAAAEWEEEEEEEEEEEDTAVFKKSPRSALCFLRSSSAVPGLLRAVRVMIPMGRNAGMPFVKIIYRRFFKFCCWDIFPVFRRSFPEKTSFPKENAYSEKRKEAPPVAHAHTEEFAPHSKYTILICVVLRVVKM